MRLKDEEKRKKVNNAVLEIVYENGISGLNYSLIAKKANVSSGTPYVYYKDKNDMLSQIYIDAKNVIDKDLEKEMSKGKSLEEKLFYGISFLAKSVLHHPLEANYVMLFKNNKENLSQEAREVAKMYMKPLMDLYAQAYEEGKISIQNPSILNAILIAPVYWMAEENRDITYEELEELIRLGVKSVLVK